MLSYFFRILLNLLTKYCQDEHCAWLCNATKLQPHFPTFNRTLPPPPWLLRSHQSTQPTVPWLGLPPSTDTTQPQRLQWRCPRRYHDFRWLLYTRHGNGLCALQHGNVRPWDRQWFDEWWQWHAGLPSSPRTPPSRLYRGGGRMW